MELRFGFGNGVQCVTVPERNLSGVLRPDPVRSKKSGEMEIARALAHPISSLPLRELVRPGERVAIVTSDITRPMPSHLVLPALLKELYAAGVLPEDITVVFALGSHRSHTVEEQRKLVGEQVWKEVRCVDSDPRELVRLGITESGTPVDIARVVAEADRRICLGNIEFHYFAGYSGGAKALMPGVSGRTAIQSNHRLMVHPMAAAGVLDGNPVRMDIEEAGRICGIDFILNVVLDEQKEIIHAVAGHPVDAHRAGCKFLDTLYRMEIPAAADIVLVSQGGYPKDLNLYQTQKALNNAAQAVKPGGIIVLIGSCREGLGDETFSQWMTAASTPQSIVERMKTDFQLGGHKAAAMASVLEKAEIWLVSELPEDLVRSMFLTPKATIQKALDDAFVKLGNNATVLAIPCGGSVLPTIKYHRD